MKGILILSLLGLSLHSALAVSPFEVIVEEWEVNIFIMSIKHDDSFNIHRPGSSSTIRAMSMEPMKMLFPVKRKASE